ncbi:MULTISPECIES: hypothetical protein [unclassified Achromobacter]|uniref:hypothetical protein n=1 Tax=unclassified Achromobacter TaxID=2626865 RepID=UPI000B51B174|nr:MULTISPECIES: hypothetical protein [unclassified Achromobacter]OWT68097.1 hypothetical protein CEY05_29120 [Achromobacter sp. HZ34]OWT69934.1 hypothetical protein CEY04_27950 [Achromobacter sp. HZ28]
MVETQKPSETDRFPPGMSEDARAILSAFEGWRREERADNSSQHSENQLRIEAVDEKVMKLNKLLESSFPDGDPEGHRRYHEAIIKREERREEFYQKLFTELASKGLWALIGFLCVAVWFSIREHIK